ncbi:MAG: hypothetical protein KC731_17490, partial [Myxococcales bacterium]|nr:hypothetical protein [Myxococcales bacterium]
MADDDGPTGCFLGSRLGWDALEVRRWNGRARLGELYLHRIDVMPYRGGAPCDSTDLLGESATLLMPGREPMRVHGVVTQVMEGAAPGGGDRLVLEPLLALLRRRHHHRHFVDRPLRDVVREVLDHDG